MCIPSKVVLPAILAISCVSSTDISVNRKGSPCRLRPAVRASEVAPTPEVAAPPEVVEKPEIETIKEPEVEETEAKAGKYTGAPTSPGTCSGVGVSLTNSKRIFALCEATNIY
jgi:hypothetical protein